MCVTDSIPRVCLYSMNSRLSFSFTFMSWIYHLPLISIMIKVPCFPIPPDLYMHLSACYFRISSPDPNPLIPASSPLQSHSSWCQPITAVYRISQPPITSSVGKKSWWEFQWWGSQGVPPVVALNIMWCFERLKMGYAVMAKIIGTPGIFPENA